MIATKINIYIFIVTCLRSRACSLQPEHYIRPTVQRSSLMNGNESIAFNKRKFILFLPRIHKRKLTTMNNKKTRLPNNLCGQCFQAVLSYFLLLIFFWKLTNISNTTILFEFVIEYFFGQLGWLSECGEGFSTVRRDVGL